MTHISGKKNTQLYLTLVEENSIFAKKLARDSTSTGLEYVRAKDIFVLDNSSLHHLWASKGTRERVSVEKYDMRFEQE